MNMVDFERKIQLMVEAQDLSQMVNTARFEGKIPSDEITVRLCEILDILADDMVEGYL